MILAWEYPGVNSVQGSALARRIGQVAKGLMSEYEVLVMHPDHQQEGSSRIEIGDSLVRLPIHFRTKTNTPTFILLRKLQTLMVALRRGDRTSLLIDFYNKAIKEKIDFDIVIAFYSPRGPVFHAKRLATEFNKPFIVDVQDPIDDGYDHKLSKFFNSLWSRIFFRNAHVVLADPAWIKPFERIKAASMNVMRHAIPMPIIAQASEFNDIQEVPTLFYYGSIDRVTQNPILFLDTLNNIQFPICFDYAGSESVNKIFEEGILNPNVTYRYHGWLPLQKVHELAHSSDVLVLIPLYADRVLVPSKFFEYLSINKPVFIVGRDNGGVLSLLDELGHPNVIHDNIDKSLEVLANLNAGNSKGLFELRHCAKKPIEESDLIAFYNSLVFKLLN